MPSLEARQTFAADTTPIEITSAIGVQKEYWIACHNPEAAGGYTAYIVASAADANATALDIPPQYHTITGPFEELPFLYCGAAKNIYVTIIGYDQPSGSEFSHTRHAVIDDDDAMREYEFTETFTHASFTAAAVAEEVNCTGFPANVLVSHTWIELNECFSGGAATGVALEAGDAGDPNGQFTSTSVFTGASTTTPLFAAGAETTLRFEAAFTPSVTLTADVDVVDLTAGSFTIHIVYLTMPLLT
jgi:hypothetical protein